jgi:hypothetical protein
VAPGEIVIVTGPKRENRDLTTDGAKAVPHRRYDGGVSRRRHAQSGGGRRDPRPAGAGPRAARSDFEQARYPKVNGVVKQDGNTKDLICDEAHLIRYLSSMLTLYPGDVIMTGTPDGVGAGRQPPEFLKPGDVVTIEIDGIGTLRTPMRRRRHDGA